VNSVGNSVIFGHDGFPWTDGNFQMPAWHELVIYEKHAGTLNDHPGGPPGTLDHVDGLRWDSTVNRRRHNLGDNPDGWSLLQWINDEIDAVQPWTLIIAEDMQTHRVAP
jgi:hypothetical protein